MGQVVNGDEDQVVFHPVGALPLYGSQHSAITRTDSQGHYRLANLPAGKYEVWAQGASNDWKNIDWVSTSVGNLDPAPGAKPLQVPDLVIGPGGTIRGRLVDAATGKPLDVAGKKLQVSAVYFFVDGTPQQQPLPQEVSVADDGTFTVRAFPTRARLWVNVRREGESGGPLANEYRSSDDFHRSGRVFDLKHGEAIDAKYEVWHTAELEKLRQKIQAGYEAQASGDDEAAVDLFSEVLQLDSESVTALAARANALEHLGRDQEALADYEALGKTTSMDPFGNWRIADLMATSNDPLVRDGQQAIEVAKKVLAAIRHQPSSVENEINALALLAAAQAEAGDFEAAVATQREAMEKAGEGAKAEMRKRLEAFEAGRAWRREGKVAE